MGLRSLFFRGKANRAQALDWPSTVTVGSYSPRYRDFSSYMRAYRDVPWVRPCVSVLAYNAANVELELVLPGATEADDEVIPDSALLDLLGQPNPDQSGFALFEATHTDLELVGNCWWALEGLDGAGRPAELYRLFPPGVQVLPSRERRVGGYRYTVNGRSIDYAPDEMLHIRYPNPLDDHYGMGTIEAFEHRADSARSMSEHEAGFWQNGGKITGILSTDQDVDSSKWKRILQDVRGFFRGAGFSTLILENGFKYQSVSASPARLGLLEMSKASRDEILAAFGVPPTKVGILENANYKAQSADAYFWCFTAGTPITVRDRGPVPIEEIVAGDLLLTHEGRYRPVVEARSRRYYGRLYTVTLARHAAPLEVSEEHPFLVQRQGLEQWVRVGDLAAGDLVLGPRLAAENAAAVPVRSIPFIPKNGRGPRPTRDISVTPERAWAIGRYLADGCIIARSNGDPERASISVGVTKAEDANRLVGIFSAFGPATRSALRHGSITVSTGRAAATLLLECGHRASEKRLPAWLLEAPEAVLRAALAGYWRGDGMMDRYRLRASTVSERLAHDVRIAFTRLGAVPSVHHVAASVRVSNGMTITAREAWLVDFTGRDAAAARSILGVPALALTARGRWDRGGATVVDDRYVAYRIESLSWRRANGERIYNMEVAEDHSYTADGILAHNTESIDPRLTRMEQALQPLVERFHPGQGMRLRFKRLNFEDDLPAAMVAKALAETGVKRVDELRAYLGDTPIGGDVGAMLVVPTVLALTPTAASVPNLGVTLGDLVPVSGANGTNGTNGTALPALITNVPPNAGASKRLASQRRPAVAHLLNRRRQTVERQAVTRYTPRLSQVFTAQEKRVRAALERTKRRKSKLRITDVWDDETEDDALAPVLGVLHDDAIDSAYGSATAAGVTILVGASSPRLADLRSALANRARGINATTRNALDTTIQAGVQEDYSTAQILDGVPEDGYGGVASVFAQARDSRATMIARTESMVAYNAASMLAYRDSGTVDQVEMLDGDYDPICADLNGTVVSLDEADTLLADEHPNGNRMAIPLGGEGAS